MYKFVIISSPYPSSFHVPIVLSLYLSYLLCTYHLVAMHIISSPCFSFRLCALHLVSVPIIQYMCLLSLLSFRLSVHHAISVPTISSLFYCIYHLVFVPIISSLQLSCVCSYKRWEIGNSLV